MNIYAKFSLLTLCGMGFSLRFVFMRRQMRLSLPTVIFLLFHYKAYRRDTRDLGISLENKAMSFTNVVDGL